MMSYIKEAYMRSIDYAHKFTEKCTHKFRLEYVQKFKVECARKFRLEYTYKFKAEDTPLHSNSRLIFKFEEDDMTYL